MVAFVLWFNFPKIAPSQPSLVKEGLPQSPIQITVWTFFTALLWVVPAIAQVSISPLVIEVEAKRGQAQGVINVGNNTNETFRSRVYAEFFTYSRDAGFQTLEKGQESDLTPYLQFSPTELNVPPGVERRIRFIVRLPPNLPDREYRAVVFTENLKQSINGNGNNIAISTRIGVTIYLRQGKISPNIAVKEATWNSEQKQLQMLVINTGEASARPQVNWSLKQGQKVVTTGNLNPTGIIAKSERNFLLGYPGKDQSLLAPGEYQLSGELNWSEGENQRAKSFTVNLIIPDIVRGKKINNE